MITTANAANRNAGFPRCNAAQQIARTNMLAGNASARVMVSCAIKALAMAPRAVPASRCIDMLRVASSADCITIDVATAQYASGRPRERATSQLTLAITAERA